MMQMTGRVLVVAGSDSGGGAGIQADTKTVTALGGYAATAITALTAQNTRGVFGVHPTPLPFLRQQMELVLDDIGVDAVKTGMLADAATIDLVADVLEEKARGVPLVLDPVMIAKGGHVLLAETALDTFKHRLSFLATVITPNIPEAEALSGMTIQDLDDMQHAAGMLLTLGGSAVLLKGGHLDTDVVTDILATPEGFVRFESPRIQTRHVHGTGCTLASAIAAGLAQKMTLVDAVRRARAYVHAAIEAAPGFGQGCGPLNHAITVSQERISTLK